MSITTKLTITAITAAMTFSTFALSITPSTGTLNMSRYEFDENDQSALDGLVDSTTGGATLLYKDNVGGSEEGSLAASYDTTFSNTASDPEDALIEYVGGDIVGPTAWLLVKDGNQDPAAYLFNLTLLGWNGTDDLELTGFWDAQGAISHVSLYGGRPPQQTPDGGATAALLGIGLLGLVAFRQKR